VARATEEQGELFSRPAPPAAVDEDAEPVAPLALTLWRPWTWAILSLPLPYAKRIENRPWPPPRWILGRWVLLHAGATYDEEGGDWIRSAHCPTGVRPPSAADDPCGIVGAMLVTGSLISGPGGNSDPTGWLACPEGRPIGYGWQIEQVVRLERPVPARGLQKLWPLRDPVAQAAVVEQLPDHVVAGLVLR
jgi:hypothetical protein